MRRHQYQWRLSVCMQRQLMLSWKSANSSCRVIVCTSRSRHFEGGNTLLCPNYTYILGGFIEIFSHISIEMRSHIDWCYGWGPNHHGSLYLFAMTHAEPSQSNWIAPQLSPKAWVVQSVQTVLIHGVLHWIYWLLWSSCRCTWLASEAKPKQMQTRVRSRDG